MVECSMWRWNDLRNLWKSITHNVNIRETPKLYMYSLVFLIKKFRKIKRKKRWSSDKFIPIYQKNRKEIRRRPPKPLPSTCFFRPYFLRLFHKHICNLGKGYKESEHIWLFYFYLQTTTDRITYHILEYRERYSEITLSHVTHHSISS